MVKKRIERMSRSTLLNIPTTSSISTANLGAIHNLLIHVLNMK